MDLPQIDLMINATGMPMVRVAYEAEYTEIGPLIAAVPALVQPDHAQDAALAVNHLSEGFEYGVILDPQSFRAEYMAQYDAEEGADWQQGQPRLRDFGMPDLSLLAPPTIDDGTLVFFADDKYLGLAYHVTMSLSDPSPDYQPLPVAP